ncbi:MAG: hypothetical protein JW702_01715 [Clostridiales bacterium]|nr:hypothetical protein [Clostridiales bacterium]
MGKYDFDDAMGRIENGTIYKWYRQDDEDGLNRSVIEGADESTYTLTENEIGKYIDFSVQVAVEDDIFVSVFDV